MYVCVGVRTEGIEYGWIYSTNLPDRVMCMHVVNGVSVDPFLYLSPRPPKVVEVVEVMSVWLCFTTKSLNRQVEVK